MYGAIKNIRSLSRTMRGIWKPRKFSLLSSRISCLKEFLVFSTNIFHIHSKFILFLLQGPPNQQSVMVFSPDMVVILRKNRSNPPVIPIAIKISIFPFISASFFFQRIFSLNLLKFSRIKKEKRIFFGAIFFLSRRVLMLSNFLNICSKRKEGRINFQRCEASFLIIFLFKRQFFFLQTGSSSCSPTGICSSPKTPLSILGNF